MRLISLKKNYTAIPIYVISCFLPSEVIHTQMTLLSMCGGGVAMIPLW